ncbi:GH92 family glycosyl hydrolase [Sinomicrobium sp. M5D2P9]
MILPFLILNSLLLFAQQNVVWEIGQPDNSARGFALYPDQYRKFVEKDFGFEDRFFVIGHHKPEEDWPFVIPGPENSWGGTSNTAGIRSHVLNAEFELQKPKADTNFTLHIDLLDTDSLRAPRLRIIINGNPQSFILKKGTGMALTKGQTPPSSEQSLDIDIPEDILREGNNEISFSVTEGGWIAFDQVKLIATKPVELQKPGSLIIKSVKPAAYERLKDSKSYQPLLVRLLRLEGEPELEFKLDRKPVFSKTITKDTYELEIPMPSVKNMVQSDYEIWSGNRLLQKGTVNRSPQKQATPADAVNTLLGTGHSRWMIAPGPWMPFGMVKLSPDNQNSGWQAGYNPTFESIGTFSHIHEWTMAGLGTFPTTGTLQTTIGDESNPESGYRSRFDLTSEEAPLGYYKVHLTDTDITTAITATTRGSFQQYTYNNSPEGRIMIDLTIPAEYGYEVVKAEIKKVDDFKLEGYSHQVSRDVWAGGVNQEYIVHFVMEFDRPIANYGSWINNATAKDTDLKTENPEKAGMYVEFDTRTKKQVQLRTGISYVSIDNAALNLRTEITTPFDWDFNAVVNANRAAWNELLSRIQIQSDDKREYERFYTNMYRSLAGRNIYSDVDGRWRNADEEIIRFDDPAQLALGCDAFWNTFWNLNQFWNLVTPEWSSQWVKSQLAMYDNNGWLAKGPAGMEYIPVMVAEHEIPLIVGAYQMGIRDFDSDKALEAMQKMQTAMPAEVGGGYAGNRDLKTYLEHHYVPYDQGRFSNSLEYSFDDWTVGQFAKALGKKDIYHAFNERGTWWQNVIDPETGFARLKDAKGNWMQDFDPFKSGANKHYVEGNAWQLTFFVPQDIPGLISKIGKEKFLERLEWGFEESDTWRFNGPNDQYWDYPVVQGNQQSMHFAFLFNQAGKPWLTQKWSRRILERYYGYGKENAYLGDEDQGQMSAWFVMNSIGLFQTDGGSRVDPVYELGSPLFSEITIDLGERYGRGKTFVIRAQNASHKNKYIQKATLNGKPLNQPWFPAKELLKGGELLLEMGPEPDKTWGTVSIRNKP